MPRTGPSNLITIFECTGLEGSFKIQTVTGHKYWLLRKAPAVSKDTHARATWEQVSEHYSFNTVVQIAVQLATVPFKPLHTWKLRDASNTD